MNLRLLALASIVGIGATANAALVMDQLPRDIAEIQTVLASQDFETANDAFDIFVIDDFTVNASQLQVTNVTAHMGGFGGFVDTNWSDAAIVRGFRVSIFGSVADAGNNISVASVVVNHGAASIGAGYGIFFDRVVSLAVNLALPAAGTYWVGVQGLMDFPGNGQIGVAGSTWAGSFPGGLDAWQANPGEGFGQGKTFLITPATNAAYSVEAVPEPATMLALGAGAAALIARRRRKNA